MKMEEEVHSDDDLVELIRLGDEKAADELIKRYYRSILHYCRNHCFNQEKAEDLTQETFLKLFKNLSGYKGKRRFRAYLYTIANHLCIDESRKTEVYSCGQRAKCACKHAHLATAAGVNTPQLCCVASLMPRQLAAGLLTRSTIKR